MSSPDAFDCCGYMRVSTEQQAGETRTSIADQRAAIEALAARLGRTVQRWYIDEGVSGATAERQHFAAMLRDCAAAPRTARNRGLVLVLNDSRWGRFPDSDEAAALRFQLSRAGWLVRFCENDESEDPNFRPVIRALASAGASEYRRVIQRNAKRGARGTAEQGYWTTRAPFGYRRAVVYPAGRERVLESGVRKAADEKVRLVPGPADEVALVQWLYATYADGCADGATLGALTRAAALRWPVREWSVPALREILHNPAYVGDVVGGRRPGDVAERALHRVRPVSAWYGKRDAHEALVSREMAAAVTARLAGNAARPRAVRSRYALSGVVRCAICGGAMIGAGNYNATAARAGRRLYRCSTAMADRRAGRESRCPGTLGAVSQHLLDAAVVALVAREVSRPAAQARIAAAVDRALARLRDTDRPAVAVEKARRTVLELEARRDRLVGLLAAGTVSETEGAATLADLRVALASAVVHRDQVTATARATAASVARTADTRATLIAAAQQFRTLAAHATGAELSRLLRPWIAGATFDKHTREVQVSIYHVPVVGTNTVASGSMPGHAAPKHAVAQESAPNGVTVRRASLAAYRQGGRVRV